MDLPRINGAGLLEVPPDYERTPRRYPMPLRLLATVLLVIFFGVVLVTGAVSLGAYCLTSQGADGRALEPGLEGLSTESTP